MSKTRSSASTLSPRGQLRQLLPKIRRNNELKPFVSSFKLPSYFLPYPFGSSLSLHQHLEKMRNYSGLIAVVQGMERSAARRLKQTWEAVPRKETELFDELVALCSPRGSYNNLRMKQSNAMLPCVPYLGLYLTELVCVVLSCYRPCCAVHPVLTGRSKSKNRNLCLWVKSSTGNDAA